MGGTAWSWARSSGAGLAVLAGLAALLPEPLAALPGRSYFFRDFSIAFYPLRAFHARELREGRVPFWNPYLNEGAFALPSLYPPDLLHAIDPGPAFVSWLLTLHLPLAAILAFLLARELGSDARGAFVAGAAFALGGLTLSCLNLYVFLQALALAPLIVLALRRAARQGGRWIAGAAGALALGSSTLAIEFVAQAVLLGAGLALAGRGDRRAALRTAAAVGLGLGLSAVPIAVVLGLLPETPRGAGLGGEVALANDVHPLVLLQSLVPHLFGSLADPAGAFWGGAFFSKGLPYFLSLYLGPAVLALAWAGLDRCAARERRVLLAALVLGLWYALGARGGLAWLLARLPGADAFRFPSKALLLPYLSIGLLAGIGATGLRDVRGWAPVKRACAALAGLLLVLVGALWAFPGPLLGLAGIVPSASPAVLRAVSGSALGSLVVAAAALAVAHGVQRGRLEAGRARALVGLVVVFDLARAGSGMNPQVSPGFLEPLPELRGRALPAEGGRAFSYGLDHSPAFRRILDAGGPRLAFTSFFLSRQLLAPYANVLDGVEAAEGKDLTSFVPRPPELGPEDFDPGRIGVLLPWLRNAGVTRVFSLDPLAHPDLRLLAEARLGEVAAVRVYALEGASPAARLACRVVVAASAQQAMAAPYAPGFDAGRDVALEVAGAASCGSGAAVRTGFHAGFERYRTQADGAGYLVSRASFARGWTALVDGRPAPVLRANGKHKAVAVGAGAHEVVLRYEPPGLRLGLVLFGAALFVFAGVLARGGRREGDGDA